MAARWTRVVGLVLAATLSGAPAALVACTAVCLPMPAMAHTSVAAAPAPVPAGGAAAPALHHHHHSEAPPPAAPGGATVSAGASLHACCPEPQALTAGAVAVLRLDASGVSAVATTPVVWLLARPSSAVRHLARPPSLAAARARTPLVLRI